MTAIDRTARLTAYSLAERLIQAESDVRERCRQLALDDLTLAAISLRRLTEATSLEPRTRNLWVSTLKFETHDFHGRAIRDEQISLWSLLGILVHARMIKIVDDELSLAMWLAPKAIDAVVNWRRDQPLWVDPICFVRSDRRSEAFFVSELSMKVAQLLECARDVCAEHGLSFDD